MVNEHEKWVNLEDIAEHLKISKDTIRVYVKNVLFRISDIDAWVESGEAGKIDISRE